MFRELEYQKKVFCTLDYYLNILSEQKVNADKVEKLAKENPDVAVPIPDFAEITFKILKSDRRLPNSRLNIPFSPRYDGCKRSVPNITLKVPTGGGKTWLALKSTSKILNSYLKQDKGFILWIVPNEAIYTQTLKHFKDRDHPYRQSLDRASAGRVKILTKTDMLNVRDVSTHLCVMILMMQSANRRTKEFLKIFRDRGDVYGFVPAEGEQHKHKQLKQSIENLDCYQGNLFLQVKDSLGNALRIIRPLVVMDEGHKAVSDLAYETLYDFNPSFVLELTATPKDVDIRSDRNARTRRYANLLVEITGQELDVEGMIKMPLILDPRQGDDWKAALLAAVTKLDALQKMALQYKSNADHYIRPILLVQVERTGIDQRDNHHIHAEDVRDWLLQTSFNASEVAIKTAQQNDLKITENLDLLSPTNQIRVIITKEALQEGWDCPFAYVLCSLASRSNVNAMTQLVGRILRQPYAQKTNIPELDQCYVFTHQSRTQELVEAIKKGLKKDGLSDLTIQVIADLNPDAKQEKNTVQRRLIFEKEKIFLPKILVKNCEKLRNLDYETDILCKTDWSAFNPALISQKINDDQYTGQRQLQRISLMEEKNIAHESIESLPELTYFDPVLAVRQISDIVINPFVGREIVGKLMKEYDNINIDKAKMGRMSSSIVEALRIMLEVEQNKQAENYFKQAVKNGDIQFRLRVDGNNWVMPETIISEKPIDEYPLPIQRSLFDPIYKTDLNKQEREVAVYLDEQKTLGWWHRNIARHHYGLQGWRRGFFYPDFIFSVAPDGKTSKLVVLEMKGEHLSGNDDTEYKKAVMSILSDNFDWDNTLPVGNLTLENQGKSVMCELILIKEWKAELSKHFNTT